MSVETPGVSPEALALSLERPFSPLDVQATIDGCDGDVKKAEGFLEAAAKLGAHPVRLLESSKDVVEAFNQVTEAFRKVGEATAKFVFEDFPSALARAQRRRAVFLELEDAERKAERFRREVLNKIKPGPLSEIRQRFRSS